MAKLIALLAALALAGCAAAPSIEYVPQKVEIPVIQPVPKVTVPAVPALAIQALTPTSTDADVAAAWVASVYQLQNDDLILRDLLKPYSQ